jgi:PKD repeat protein
VIQLIVNDGHIDSDPNTAILTVLVVTAPVNHPPVANAGPDLTASVGQTVILDGSGSSDPDGDPLYYRWTLTSKPAESNAVLAGAATVSPSFVPDLAGAYTAQLVVNDNKGGSAAAMVTVTATDVNRSPTVSLSANPVSGVVHIIVTFTATASDPDGDALTYRGPSATGQIQPGRQRKHIHIKQLACIRQ